MFSRALFFTIYIAVKVFEHNNNRDLASNAFVQKSVVDGSASSSIVDKTKTQKIPKIDENK